jgi:23S rRNA pseudouridine2604 synthase
MLPDPSLQRVSKLLAAKGLCSRREADEFIKRGWVLLDGKPVTELGTKARPEQDVRLAPQASRAQASAVTILLNKPIGYVAAQPEDGHKPAVVLIRPENQERLTDDARLEEKHLMGLAPAGRLDYDSQGLMVFTQDGPTARRLIGEGAGMEKEYLVRIQGKVEASTLTRLQYGLHLDGKPLKRAKVDRLNEDQLRFVLIEGRHRQIRRMCELVHLTVTGLKRVRIGGVRLGKLPESRWRFLRPGEKF